MEPKICFPEETLKKMKFSSLFRPSEKTGIQKSLLAYGIRAFSTVMRDRFNENAFKDKNEHFDQLIALIQVS